MRVWGVILAGVMLGIIASARGAEPATQATRPTTSVGQAGCVRAECHAGIKERKVLHGPVAVHACDACHSLVDAEAHTWTLARDKEAMCTYCHEFSVKDMPVVHKPVAQGQCLGCHDPHGGKTHSLTREDSTPQLCGRCHESMTAGKAFLHSPVAQGECDSCHSPHASRFGKLLDAKGPDLCLTCHQGFEASLAKAKFTHEAMKDGCEKCHDVHGSSQPMALKQPLLDLCSGCHQKVKDQAQQASFPHKIVTQDRACMNCHTPHGGGMARLMSDVPARTCMNCHSQKVKAERGVTVAAVPEVMDPKTLKHGPVRDGQCGGCHSAHGGARPMLLTANYSTKLYHQKFSAENFELCFTCHDVRLAQQEQTTTLTNFRDGRRNLHVVHVSGVRGESCRICHASHAGTSERNIRDLVQFGVWAMPINLKKTETGGSCSPGCHTPYGYDRDKPVGTTDPTTRPRQLIARAQREELTPIHWSGPDASGAAVTLPGNDVPTVLVFIRADQSEDRQVLKLIAAALPAESKARMLLVVSGEQAGARAAELAQARTIAAPIIADESQGLAGQAGVHTWPMTVVLRRDGLPMVRISGTAESLAVKLASYLAEDDGGRGPTTRPHPVQETQVVGDEPAKLAGRQLRVAEIFLAQGDAHQAQRILTEALKSQPDSVPLRVGMARALLQLDRANDALNLLNKLPKDALTPGEGALLRGRILMAAGKFDEAKALLTNTLTATPDLAEAHFLLGQIHEHDQDWQNAALEYRTVQELKKK